MTEVEMTTGEKLDHTLRAYARLERKYYERGQRLTEWIERAEAAEAALEALHAAEPSRAENAKLRARVSELEEAFDAAGGDWTHTFKRLLELEAALQGAEWCLHRASTIHVSGDDLDTYAKHRLAIKDALKGREGGVSADCMTCGFDLPYEGPCHVCTLRHRVDELRAALVPFAKLADAADAFRHPERSSCEWRIAYSDLAAARTALMEPTLDGPTPTAPTEELRLADPPESFHESDGAQ